MEDRKNKLFEDYVIVSCGTLSPELNYLRKDGFLDAKKILYTKPGRHEVPQELESELIKKINIKIEQREQKGVILLF